MMLNFQKEVNKYHMYKQIICLLYTQMSCNNWTNLNKTRHVFVVNNPNSPIFSQFLEPFKTWNYYSNNINNQNYMWKEDSILLDNHSDWLEAAVTSDMIFIATARSKYISIMYIMKRGIHWYEILVILQIRLKPHMKNMKYDWLTASAVNKFM